MCMGIRKCVGYCQLPMYNVHVHKSFLSYVNQVRTVYCGWHHSLGRGYRTL